MWILYMNEKVSFIQGWMQKMLSEKTKDKLEKTIIIILLGFFLLIAVPTNKNNHKINSHITSKKSESSVSKKEYEKDAYIGGLENKLKQIIEGMEGAGKTQVMITLKDHGEKILDKNQPYENETRTEKDSSKEVEDSRIRSEQETVLIEQDGDTTPFVIMERYPEIEGVVVVCEGGDQKELALHIKEAVQALFDIDIHKVCVCKSHNKKG